MAFGPTLFMVKSLPSVQTERGLCRAWLRQVLNQNGVEYNIKAMLRQKTQVAAAYGAHALFRKAERMSLCLAHLQSLNGIGFDLQVNSDAFDDGAVLRWQRDVAVVVSPHREHLLCRHYEQRHRRRERGERGRRWRDDDFCARRWSQCGERRVHGSISYAQRRCRVV